MSVSTFKRLLRLFWETNRHFLLSDLSDCQLQQVPDAIFMLMQNTSLVSCNLSHNVINKIPAKLAIKWTLLTGEDFLLYDSIHPGKRGNSWIEILNLVDRVPAQSAVTVI